MPMHIKKYLTERAVIEIFAARPRPSPVTGELPAKSKMSRTVAKMYGVSTSTVQQIWNRKCWTKVTAPFCEAWETSRMIARCEDEASSSDTDCDSATRRPDSDVCDWATGAFESDGYTLLDDVKRLPGFYSEDPFEVDWGSALSTASLAIMSNEKSTFDWKREELESRLEWSLDVLQAELVGSTPMYPLE
eukprot:2441645-Rhodomonas_salina.1